MNKKRKKSQDKIENVFLKLIQNNNIEDITITNICKLANVNRSTFYSNYIDIYDLINKIKEEMAIKFAEYHLSINAKQDYNGYLNMFKYIKNNQLFFKTYFKLEDIYPSIPTIYNNKDNYIDYQIEFFKSGLNAVIKKWLNNNCKEKEEDIVKIIIKNK